VEYLEDLASHPEPAIAITLSATGVVLLVLAWVAWLRHRS